MSSVLAVRVSVATVRIAPHSANCLTVSHPALQKSPALIPESVIKYKRLMMSLEWRLEL